MKTKIFAILVLVGILSASMSLAQTTTNQSAPVNQAYSNTSRGYFYKAIYADIVINQNTTLDVIETQTYSFAGEYHQGWRSIPLRRIDSITDIAVFDAAGTPLVYSPRQLDKLDPTSWGKYTYFKKDGAMNIEWYFSAKDTDQTWQIKYRAHGALTFNRANDQLYWNIFTDYSVPVRAVSATAHLPRVEPGDQTHYFTYRSRYPDRDTVTESNFNQREGTIFFNSSGFETGEDFTIDIDWPRGAVNRASYLLDFARLYYGYIGSILIVILSILFAIFYWLRKEVWVKGRGVVVAQYEPPRGLSPAIMRVIATESTGLQGLPATIIDLAVRGYVTVEQKDPPSALAMFFERHKNIKKMLAIFLSLALAYFFAGEFILKYRGSLAGMPSPILIYVLALALMVYGIVTRFGWGTKDFVVKKIKEFANDETLQPFEKKFLTALFSEKDYFSTKEAAKASSTKKQTLYSRIGKVDQQILLDTQTITNAFEKPPAKEKYFWMIVVGMIFISVFVIKEMVYPQWVYLAYSGFVSAAILLAFAHFEARLNQSGRELKEEILGFKLFLHTAERYRLQNLTPEMFQKFLPYAMVFDIEKNWAKAFEGMQMSPPRWYSASYVGAMSSPPSLTGSSGFSAMAFSASFASSFSNAFSSSGGGGGAGGGSAGGGGGGGGGGAS